MQLAFDRKFFTKHPVEYLEKEVNDLSDWLNRIIEAARKDKNLANKVREIAKLDSKVMPKGLMSMKQLSESSQANLASTQRLSNLCDQVADAIATPDEDPDEIALWISYNCQKIAQKLSRKRWLW